MAAIGIDAVQTANSASIRSGVLGLQATIQALKSAGIEPVGTFADSSSFRSSGGYTIMEVQGLRIALVAFTKGMDNLGLPEGSGNCVNLLYTDYTTTYDEIDSSGIKKVLRNVAEEQPDLTIAMLHWGSEYNETVSASQKKIRNLMLENGVDIILGSHSHLLKGVEHDTQNNTLVAWSLGDFYGDASQPGSNYSIVLDIEVTRDNMTGETTITGFSYTPISTVQPDESLAGGQRVVRIEAAMARYEGNYLGKVTSGVYSSMEYALKRVAQRVAETVG
jgi:poly-gamma-glutamate synthesis protein (capsule biosynthesis protein)